MPEDRPPMTEICDADPLAKALAKLRPAGVTVDVSALLYQAGQASREGSVRFWKRACAITVGLAACALVAVYSSSSGPTTTSVPQEQAPESRGFSVQLRAPNAEATRLSEPKAEPEPAGRPEMDELGEYLRVQREVLAVGLDALPTHAPQTSTPTLSAADLGRTWNLPPEVLAAPYFQLPKKKANHEPE